MTRQVFSVTLDRRPNTKGFVQFALEATRPDAQSFAIDMLARHLGVRVTIDPDPSATPLLCAIPGPAPAPDPRDEDAIDDQIALTLALDCWASAFSSHVPSAPRRAVASRILLAVLQAPHHPGAQQRAFQDALEHELEILERSSARTG